MSWVSQVRSAGSRLFDIDLISRRHLSEKRAKASDARCARACVEEGLFLPSLKSIIVVPVAFRGDDGAIGPACVRPSFKGVVAILDPVLRPPSFLPTCPSLQSPVYPLACKA